MSELLSLLLSNVWKNTAIQQWDQQPNLVNREQKLQAIVVDHTSTLVSDWVQQMGGTSAITGSQLWPVGHTNLRFTTMHQHVSVSQLAEQPLQVGTTSFTFGDGMQVCARYANPPPLCTHHATPSSVYQRGHPVSSEIHQIGPEMGTQLIAKLSGLVHI